MNAKEYADYEKAVADFMEREGLNCLSSQPTNPDKADNEEWQYDTDPYFSWRSCDCCGSPLGGNREDMCGYNPTTKEVQRDYSCCVDCVYYAAYGRLDDRTMMEVEASRS